jgi:hypothetical protein
MAIKLLVATAFLLPTAESPVHAEVGETIEIDSKDDALQLARGGRAYFVDKLQDPTKGLLTAGKEETDSVKLHAKQIAAERKQRAEDAAMATPGGMAALVAQQVAAAVAAALAKPA